MARPVIPSLQDFRRNRIVRYQVKTFSHVLRAIAMGRLPGEQLFSRQAVVTRLIAAVVMSTVLWFFITNQEDPVVRSQPYVLQVVAHNIPKGLAIRGGLKPVTVIARGLQGDVNAATVFSPVVDLRGISPDAREVNVKVKIVGGNSNVEYASHPSTLSLSLEPITSKSVPVGFTAQSPLPNNLNLISQQVQPNTLTISGPADQVNQVANATVTEPLGNVAPPSPDAVSFPITFNALIPQLYDRDGHLLSSTGLQLSVTHVNVTLQINQLLSIRTLTIAPIVVGGPPLGYQMDPPQPRPSTVTVVGPPEVVSGLKAITTNDIALQGVTHSMTITAYLDLRSLPGVTVFYGGKQGATAASRHGPAWKIYIGITKVRATDFRPALVVEDGLGPGLQAKASTHWAIIAITGPYIDINKLGALFAHINVQSLGPGTYMLTPKVGLPRSLSNYSVSPEKIQVVISAVPRTTTRR